ncbi:hypothetical protein AN948_02985 [Rhodococcus sp. ADH]|nr:hypothetical protein AN948_02985 [Rhodococcus sp. ADH]RGP46717.1 hypothetical protein AWH04_06295 [Rhodococcus erythropolis]
MMSRGDATSGGRYSGDAKFARMALAGMQIFLSETSGRRTQMAIRSLIPLKAIQSLLPGVNGERSSCAKQPRLELLLLHQ